VAAPGSSDNAKEKGKGKTQAVIFDENLVSIWAAGPLRTGPPKGPSIVSINFDPVDPTAAFDNLEEQLSLGM